MNKSTPAEIVPSSVASSLCVAIGNSALEHCRALLSTHELCELRLDLLQINEHLKELLALKAKTIVTYRPKDGENDVERNHRLAVIKAAAAHGATYLDIELEADDEYTSAVIA